MSQPQAAIDGAPGAERQSPPAGQSWRLLRRLIGEAVRPYGGTLAAVLLCMVLVAATTAASAWLMSPVVNKIFVEKDRALLWLVGGAVAGTFLLKNLASYGQDTLLAYVGQRVIADLQTRLFRHLVHQDMALFEARNSGSLVSHFTFDINAMRAAVSNALVGLGRDSLTIVFLVGVMVWQDWVLSLVTLVVAPLTIVPVQRLAKRMRRVSGDIQSEMGQLTASLSQSFQGIRIIRGFGMEETESRRLADIVERLFRLNFRSARVGAAIQPIVDSFGGLAAAGIIVYDGLRVVEGSTTAGAFFSFIAAVVFAYQPMRALSKVVPSLQEGAAAAERIFALLDREPILRDAPAAAALPRIPGEIHFEAVSFGYGAERLALDGASFVAPAGQVTALVGPSGAGKSTIFNLLPRFYDPSAGRVLVNGHDLSQVTMASLRDALAIVGQDVMLFDDTILANIRYGRPGASESEVVEAARIAAADRFIRDLPQGYRTMVGERGTRLSGGQRQRLAIARALLKDAPILLLDEATSALDTESERLIQDALRLLMRGRTTLVIAHRLSTIKDAAAIHVLDQGRIVESGTHDELLLRRGGLYARLHTLQFADQALAAV
jgi:subfamily B ATP-binding cassette protein MsbA